MIRIYFLFVLSSSFYACSPKPVNVEEDIKPELRANWDTFIEAWEREDASGCSSIYLEDGINIPPLLKENNGRNEIEAFYQYLFENNLKSEYTHDIISLDGNTQNIIERGKFKVYWTRNDTTTWTYYARSLTHWQYNEGKWMIKSFVFNNPPED